MQTVGNVQEIEWCLALLMTGLKGFGHCLHLPGAEEIPVAAGTAFSLWAMQHL